MIDSSPTVIVMTAGNRHEFNQARLFIQSLRKFGGLLKNCPVWVFTPEDVQISINIRNNQGIEIFPLSMPETFSHYWFARKVFTCAYAEKYAQPKTKSLVWFSCDCLVMQPPVLLILDNEFDAAFRPVHGRNIGLPVDLPLDGFWQRIYEVVGLEESDLSVESYVDMQLIRAYFNSHTFSWNPSTGLGSEWISVFTKLVSDKQFQFKYCSDIQHQVFLHQAALSALVEKMIATERLRILPSTYSYPYNMQADVPQIRRAQFLNNLVCIAYEDRSLDPDVVRDIVIREPLRSWLSDHGK
jgi:hypothetical protein